MSVMIVGSGLTGMAVADYFEKHNIKYFFLKNDDINANIFDDEYIDELLVGVEFVILSPGVSLQKEIIFQIKKRKIALFGEIEFSSRLIKNDIIAVTGTNGKTTTVNLIYYILKNYKNGVKLGGNVGVPVISFVDKLLNELVVLEMSSYQLETVEKFKPHIAVILNITEDHLVRHGSMSEYIRCKYKIVQNQTSDDFLILNADDEILMKNPPKTQAQIFYFSTKKKVVGSYIKNNNIYFNDNQKEIKLVSLSKIKLKGEHNLSNILASVLAVYLQTGNKELLENISRFEGVPHRIEYVKTIGGVEFYNDSKATNIASVLVALKSFSTPINLILGGSDKGYGFDELFKNLPKNVKNIAVFGETKNKIALSAKMMNYYNIIICDNLESSTKALYGLAMPGDVVLLSPACASFDFFNNFEERGNCFKKIVREIELNEGS